MGGRSPDEARRATASQAKYDAGHTRRITLKLNTRTDADVLAWLEAQPSMQGAIKAAIREKLEDKTVADKKKQYDYITKWEAENYDKVLVRFPKGTKDRIAVAVTDNSLNGFIVGLVLEKLEELEAQNGTR